MVSIMARHQTIFTWQMERISQKALLFQNVYLEPKARRELLIWCGSISKWSWLDYNEANYHVVCFYCSRANRRNLLPDGFRQKYEETYVTRGFTNWKDACESFEVRIIFQMCMATICPTLPLQDFLLLPCFHGIWVIKQTKQRAEQTTAMPRGQYIFKCLLLQHMRSIDSLIIAIPLSHACQQHLLGLCVFIQIQGQV